MAFARDTATAAYYEQRAAEYDDWWEGRGLFAARDRPGWDDDVRAVVALVAALSAARTLDVACGTGFLTRHLSGFVVGLDQSRGMAAIAQARLPDGLALVGDALALPFADGAFDRVITGHFYGHLPPEERATFLAQAGRVADELIVIDSALRPDVAPEAWQERTLNDGSRHRVFKRHLTAAQLADEIGGEPLWSGRWFVAARAAR
jgi:SAM-dependent methyltransferase